MKLDFRVWLVLLVVMTCFAANSVITRYLVLVSRVSPFLLTVIRFVSGLFMLMILTSTRPSTFRHARPGFSYLPGAVFLGAYAFAISYGYLFIPVAAGTFVFYTFVVLTMFAYSIIEDKEKLTTPLTTGAIVRFARGASHNFQQNRLSNITWCITNGCNRHVMGIVLCVRQEVRDHLQLHIQQLSDFRSRCNHCFDDSRAFRSIDFDKHFASGPRISVVYGYGKHGSKLHCLECNREEDRSIARRARSTWSPHPRSIYGNNLLSRTS